MNTRRIVLHGLGICLCLALVPDWCWGQADSQNAQDSGNAAGAQEPTFYDYYVNLQEMQERFAQRSLDEQNRLQPQMRKAERRACQQLRKEREEGARSSDYRSQGGDQFVAFSQQFERYCQTIQ